MGWNETRIRNRAVVELARWPELTCTVLVGLDAKQVRQNPQTGTLSVHYRDNVALWLDRPAHDALFDHLEVARLWGSDGPLFRTRGRRGSSRCGDRLRPSSIRWILHEART